MQEYEDIVRGQDRAVSTLSSSSVVQFFVSALVLTVAIGGAAINFSLIARPMAEMVGGTSYIGTFRTANVAALVIIMVEISMGLFLMESLRITRLFPVIGALPDKIRVRMMWITFAILTLLASVEAGLAYMREVLLQDELATGALLRGESGGGLQNEYLWITTAAQMGMGFILPFALTFVAIPLETFVHSLRTVLGLAGIALLRFVALVLRVLSSIVRHLGTLAQRIYDLPLFVPLWLETEDEASVRLFGRSGSSVGGADMKTLVLALTIVGLALALGACAPAAPRNTGVYLLLDTSGTYSNELRKAETIILYTLVATGADRLVRGRAHRHRQLQREGHHREGNLRRPAEHREHAEARVRRRGATVRRAFRIGAVHRHQRRLAAGDRVPQRKASRAQDDPDLLRPEGRPGQGLRARRAARPEGLRGRGAQRDQAAHGQLRP